MEENKIDYEAIIEKIASYDILYSEIENMMKEVVKQAIPIILNTVKEEAIVDIIIIDVKKNTNPEGIEAYIVNGSLDEIQEKLIKELC